ncbi:probable LRR receptor-like serine/threonine-protein kinase At3g47570 [Rhododendron vialii]|uniref:probable LRR receptor-like serine/threonine-protein kinase At3g47570 n=1 Tax=Rhododendron vialii TaxID=182163 RepID=UPI00266059B4|nr:probable LRR receptor-like serine/threonine-protein kinase At3g47570 [Rhododendron vialii]
MSSLTNCTRLQCLLVNGNLLKGSLPDFIANLSIGLDRMVLGGNQLHGSIPSGIGNLLNLTVLSMRSNYFSGSIPGTIGRLRKLQYLELDMNKFTELPSSIFGNITALNRLLLGKNNIHGSIPSSLGNCQNLLKLDLSHNNLYGSLPLEILNLSSISISFNLGYNSLTGSLPSEVGSLKVLNLQLRGALKSFMLECKALQTIRHRNLLKVLSACSSIDFHGNEFKAIVYEFMANGTLDGWLHQNRVGEHEYLKMIQRLDISIDVASALEYLHCGCESKIIHGDLKPSNVLLDDTIVKS